MTLTSGRKPAACRGGLWPRKDQRTRTAASKRRYVDLFRRLTVLDCYVLDLVRQICAETDERVQWRLTKRVRRATWLAGAALVGVLDFQAGQTSQPLVLNVVGDTAVEADETFTVRLANPSENASIATDSA